MTKINNSSFPDDAILLDGILRGSDETLRLLYKGIYPTIQQFIVSNSGDEDDAQDVFQEGVIVLYNKVRAGNFVLSSKIKTYMYAVCRRIWLKKLSRNNIKVYDVMEYADVLTATDDIEQHEEREVYFGKMQAALDELGEPCSTIIKDFYLNNRSMQEITEKFGYTSSDNAKTQKYKCLQRLKKLFNKG